LRSGVAGRGAGLLPVNRGARGVRRAPAHPPGAGRPWPRG
jgi:hypothetical protein